MGATILLVDDQENEGLLIENALRKLDPGVRLMRVPDGHDAISYLKGEGSYRDRAKFPNPSLILLDLNMPRMDGFEFLGWMQEYKELIRIPVVVLSGSFCEEDCARAMATGAASWLTKSADTGALRTELKALLEKWVPLKRV